MADVEMGTIRAKTTADNSQFNSEMKKSAGIVDATARENAKAKKQEAAAIAFAAKFAGDAVTDGSRQIVKAIQAEKAARSDLAKANALAKVEYRGQEASVDLAAAALQRYAAAQRATQAAMAASSVATKASTAAISEHAVVSQRMAASAAVRGLESGNVGIRSVENFLTTIPGVGKALQAIFPVLGAAAFVGVIVEMGVKLAEAAKEAAGLGRKLSDAFRDEHLSVASSTDALKLHNDELQNQINKLEHRPQNGLLLEIDANILAMDRLAKGAIDAQKRVKDLLKENKVGFLGEFLHHGSTAAVAGSVNSYRQDLADLAYQQSEQMRTGNKAGAAATGQAYAAKGASYNAWLNSQIAMRSAAGYGVGHGSQSENLAILRGERIDLRDDATAEEERKRTGPLDGKKAALESAKASGEAANKAAELELKAMEARVAAMKLNGNASDKAIYEFWDTQRNAFAVGSQQYNTIVEKQASLAEADARKASERIKRFVEEEKRMGEEAARLPQNAMASWQRDSSRAAADARDASNETNAQVARNTAREAELAVQQASGRTMTAIAAATALAAIHTREYGAELFRLQERLKAVETDPSLSSSQDDKQKKIAELEKEIAQAKANRRVQSLQDALGINPGSTSAFVGIASSLDTFQRAVTNAGAVLESVFSSALSTTNGAILQSLTTRNTRGQHIFGQAGSQIFKSVAGAGLNAAEGSVLGALHVGKGHKPTGTASDPLHVVMGGLGAAGSAAGNAAKAIGGGLSGFFHSALSFIPGFAGGVTNFGGGWAMVGERGPELLNLPSGSNVIPNHKVGGAMSGQHYHQWSIDARGSNDPAAVRAAIMEAAPHIAAAGAAQAVRHMHEQGRRSPGIRPTR